MKPAGTGAEIAFTKMSGTGNDFILIDNRTDLLQGDCSALIRRLCSRRVSIGADGLLLLEASDGADFRMRYFNADGGEAEFCGNGARCIARYAHLHGIAGSEMSFETASGRCRARVTAQEVTIDMPEPGTVQRNVAVPGEPLAVHIVTVGVPHVVVFVDDVEAIDVVGRGRRIRQAAAFQPAGTNVDFVQVAGDGDLRVRTYERGVEDETYSCGTGVCASGILAHVVHGIKVPVRITTQRGDRLMVSFQSKQGRIRQCTLAGEARVVYRGTISIE